jgi:hypothetical protein
LTAVGSVNYSDSTMTKQTDTLRAVSEAARHAQVAQDELVRRMRRARERGISLRQIAAAAGRSHEHVRKLLED